MPEAPFRNPILGPGRTPPASTQPVGPWSGQDPAPPPIFNPPPQRPSLPPLGPRQPPMGTLPVVPDEAYHPVFRPPPMPRPVQRPIDEMGLWQLAMRRMQQYY